MSDFFFGKISMFLYEQILSIAKSRDVIGFCNALINEFVWNTRFYQWNIEICLAQLCKVKIGNLSKKKKKSVMIYIKLSWLKVHINFSNAPAQLCKVNIGNDLY